MSRSPTIALAVALLFVALVAASRDAHADPHLDAVAKEALEKAAGDYASADYAGAAARLKKAAQLCGAKGCSAHTKGAVLRDLGAMEFRAGDKDGAAKHWGDALTIDPALTPNPAYDASDVGAAWEDARAGAGLAAGPISTKPPPGGAAAPLAPAPLGAAGAHGPTDAGAAGGGARAPAPVPGPPAEQPKGEFDHDPAFEQKEDTPLPVHVEYQGKSKLTKVVLKYKGAQMRDWARVELTHVGGNNYEGLIPCSDVTRGAMRYWIQGFDKTGDPVAATGDPKHTFYVPIRDKITSAPPHLAGKEPPRSCEETDCPPGLPGCKRKAAGDTGPTEAPAEGAAEGDGAEAKSAKGNDKSGPGYARLWFGLSLSLDFVPLPGATDVCRRVQATGSPINSQGYYCYDPSGSADFPTIATNTVLATGGSGTASGALQPGDIRILIAFDYAFSQNLLLGARLGFVANAYPGKSAVNQGHAFFAPLHIEARATYLLGNGHLAHAGFAPMGFAGLGLAEFDAHQSTRVRFTNGLAPQTVDAWLTDAPFFIVVGAGARYQFSPRAAATGAVKLNVVIGGNGLLPAFGPELGVVYGF